MENFDSPLTGQELGAGEHAGRVWGMLGKCQRACWERAGERAGREWGACWQRARRGMLGDGVGGYARRGPRGVCWERVGGKLGESEGHAGRQ